MCMAYFDHLVIGGPDLEALVALVASSTGVTADPGGPHNGRGTANYLIRIDDTTYIELIGPDPDQPGHEGPMPFGLESVTAPGFLGWAVPVANLASACETVSATGIDSGVIIPMTRTRPDGVVLAWELAIPPSPDLGGVMPFMIDWGTTQHPAADLGPRLDVASLSFSHPDPAPIAAAIVGVTSEAVRIDVGPPSLSVTLVGPSGELKL